MDEIEAKLRIPVDATNILTNKQSSLHAEVINTRSECQQLQNQMKNLIAVAIQSRRSEDSERNGADTTESVCSSSTTVNTVKSVDSIKEIVNSDVAIISDGESGISDGTPNPDFDTFIKLAKEGKIDFTDELLKEIYNTNARIDAINEVANTLQDKWSEIDTTINIIKSEINDIKQYIKIENLLLHKFPLPPKGYTSLQYSQYVADLLNKYLPQLPVKVKWEYISTAHTLPTKSKKSNVIIVRFCNRNIRDAIFKAKHFLPKHLAITEHLTEMNLAVLKKAQELFGYSYIHTDNCKVLINLYGKAYKVSTINEVHKLFVDYCEFIGSEESELTSLPPASISHVQTPSYHNSTINTNTYASMLKYGKESNTTHYASHNNSNRQSYHRNHPRHSKGYRGKRSTGYSVYNRKPLNYR